MHWTQTRERCYGRTRQRHTTVVCDSVRNTTQALPRRTKGKAGSAPDQIAHGHMSVASSSATSYQRLSRVRLAPCTLRMFVYESYLPHLEVQQKSGAFFGFSSPEAEHGRNTSCLEGPCSYASFSWMNIRQYTAEIPIYQRLMASCPTTTDPNAADLFLVPFFFGYMMTLGWLPAVRGAHGSLPLQSAHRQMKRAALAAKALLPHLNNATASRHVILFTCDSQFVNIELHPLLKESLVVHLGDDAFASTPTMQNADDAKDSWLFAIKSSQVKSSAIHDDAKHRLLRNAVVVPYRVSQWLPFGFKPPVVGHRALLVSMNVNVARHPIRKSVAAQLVADAERLNLASKRLLVSSKMMEPEEAALVALNSTFCVCPTGDSKGFTARFYFVMMHGCVPVRLDGWRRNVTRAPPTYPFPTLIEWSKIVIDMALEKLEPQGLLARLLQMAPQEIAERQRHLRHALQWLTYDLKNHSHRHHDAPAALIHTIQEARAVQQHGSLNTGGSQMR